VVRGLSINSGQNREGHGAARPVSPLSAEVKARGIQKIHLSAVNTRAILRDASIMPLDFFLL
jgi:hypothetical protein